MSYNHCSILQNIKRLKTKLCTFESAPISDTHFICTTSCMSSSSCYDSGIHVRAKGIFFVDTNSKNSFSKWRYYSTEFRTKKQNNVNTTLFRVPGKLYWQRGSWPLRIFISQLQTFDYTILAITFKFFLFKRIFLNPPRKSPA